MLLDEAREQHVRGGHGCVAPLPPWQWYRHRFLDALEDVGGCKVWAMNEDEMRSSNILEIFRCIQESTFRIQVEVIIENRSFPKALSIDHANTSKRRNSKILEF